MVAEHLRDGDNFLKSFVFINQNLVTIVATCYLVSIIRLILVNSGTSVRGKDLPFDICRK